MKEYIAKSKKKKKGSFFFHFPSQLEALIQEGDYLHDVFSILIIIAIVLIFMAFCPIGFLYFLLKDTRQKVFQHFSTLFGNLHFGCVKRFNIKLHSNGIAKKYFCIFILFVLVLVLVNLNYLTRSVEHKSHIERFNI